MPEVEQRLEVYDVQHFKQGSVPKIYIRSSALAIWKCSAISFIICRLRVTETEGYTQWAQDMLICQAVWDEWPASVKAGIAIHWDVLLRNAEMPDSVTLEVVDDISLTHAIQLLWVWVPLTLVPHRVRLCNLGKAWVDVGYCIETGRLCGSEQWSNGIHLMWSSFAVQASIFRLCELQSMPLPPSMDKQTFSTPFTRNVGFSAAVVAIFGWMQQLS